MPLSRRSTDVVVSKVVFEFTVFTLDSRTNVHKSSGVKSIVAGRWAKAVPYKERAQALDSEAGSFMSFPGIVLSAR